ncbi:MAG: hypothetical protein ABI333_24895 [bacterium]
MHIPPDRAHTRLIPTLLILTAAAGSDSASAATNAGARAGLPVPVRLALDQLERQAGASVRTVLRSVQRRAGAPAARVTFVGGLRLRVTGRTPEDRARTFLQAHGRVLGIRAPLQLRLHRVHAWAAGRVVRFRIAVDGLPVFGRSVVVLLRNGRVTAAAGGVPELQEIADSLPALTPAELRSALWARTGDELYRVLALGYWIQAGRAHLTYRADQYRGAPRRRWILLLDAGTGDVLSLAPGFQEAQGYVYDPSPATGPYQAVDLHGLTSTSSLEGTHARAYQCVGPHGDGYDYPTCSQRSHWASPDSNGNYLILPVEPSLTDHFAEVQGYHHATEFNLWLENRFNFAWSCAGSRAIDVHVNWNYANAQYSDGDGDPNECGDITLGEGFIDYAYDAEVIFHEFGHGLVQQAAGLGCEDVGVCIDTQGVNWIPNGLNEGMADYFSMTYTDSPTLGEHAGQDTGDPYIRTALNSAVCPWDVISQSHYDGHIWMGGAWELRQGLGASKADQLIYGALAAMPEDADFADAAAMTEQVATDLAAQGLLGTADLALIGQVLGPTGRNMVDCHRIIPLDNRPASHPSHLVYAFQTFPGYIDEFPLGLQFTLDAPANATRLNVTLQAQYGWNSAWTVYLRKDQPVYMEFDLSGVNVTADHTFTGSPTHIELAPATNPPLDPGTLYHVALVYSAPDSELFQLWGSVDTGPVQPDAGVPDAAHIPDAAPHPDGALPPRDGRARADAMVGYQVPGSFDPRAGCSCASPGSGSGDHTPLIFVIFSMLVALLRRRTS